MENKENVSILEENILDMAVMSEDSLLTRKRKKVGGCNMRKSLAWNSAFFTEEGVLDANELSSLDGSSRYCGKNSLFVEDRGTGPLTTRSSITSDVHNLKVNNNTVELRRDSKQEKKWGLKFRSSNQDVHVEAKVSTAIQSTKTMKNLAAKHGGCPPPLALNSQKKLPKSTTLEFDSSSKCKAIKGELDCTNRSLKFSQTPLSVKAGNMAPSDSSAKYKRNSGHMTSLKSVNQSSRFSTSANKQGPHDISDFINSTIVPEKMLSADLHMKPSQLRLPTPSLGFFSKAEGRQRVLSNSSVPNYKISASPYANGSNSEKKDLVKLDVKLTSDCLNHSFREAIQNNPTKDKVEPSFKVDITSNGSVMLAKDSVLFDSPFSLVRMNCDSGSETSEEHICYENSLLHKTCASSRESDSHGEGNDLASNILDDVMSNLAEKALVKGEIDDKSEQVSLKDLLSTMNADNQRPADGQLHSSLEKVDLLVKTDLESGRNVNPDEISEPTGDPFDDGNCNCPPGNSELLDCPLQCASNKNPFFVGDGKNMQVKENVFHGVKQDPQLMKLNVTPFSDEWLALLESAGEELLKTKSGAVQNSPPDKTIPEPSPWSPVKRNVVGPYECTKYRGIPPSNFNVG